MMQIPKFWQALDDLADAATDRREWQAILGSEFDLVSRFLTSTGTLATSIACPSPGGEGCPRKVVRHDDGSIRAICGDSPKACADLDLSRDDIAILGLDRTGLAKAVATALALSIPAKFERQKVFRIGSHDVFAGRGFPVFLTVPGPAPTDDATPFDDVIGLPGPKLVLTPTNASLPASVIGNLQRSDATLFALSDLLVVNDQGSLEPAQPPETLFSDLRARVEASSSTSPSNLAWQLPHDARWEDLTIRFISVAWINVTYDGVTRPFEPEAFGLKNTKKQEYTTKEAWNFLLKLAAANGRLPVHQGTPKETSKHQKQKQALSKALRQGFGIPEEPIPTKGNEYAARFVVSADDLRQGKQGQSRRNFAESD
jgi:hypothetical protein